MPGHTIVAAGHPVRRYDCVFDLALERSCETVPYFGKADFELIGMHGALPRGFAPTFHDRH
jgi:hypothetical protein